MLKKQETYNLVWNLALRIINSLIIMSRAWGGYYECGHELKEILKAEIGFIESIKGEGF